MATATVGSHTITINANDANIVLDTFVTTAGSSQATWSTAYSLTDTFRGVDVLSIMERLSPTVDGYHVGDAVNVLRRGTSWVTTMVQVQPDQNAYVNAADATKLGQFTNVSTGNIGPVGVFRDQVSASLALVELNMP